MKRVLLAPILGLLVLSQAGCDTEEFDDLKEYVQTACKDCYGNIPPPPTVEPYVPFNYKNPDGLPDPFLPKKSEKQDDNNQVKKCDKNSKDTDCTPPPETKHPREELEDYPLESLKVVGYLFIKKAPNALIKAPDGKLYYVRVGNYMGQNFGKVSSITENELKLKEHVQDSTTGRWKERESTLLLLQE